LKHILLLGYGCQQVKLSLSSKQHPAAAKNPLEYLLQGSGSGESIENPNPLELAEESRLAQIDVGDRQRRGGLGQFFTGVDTAKLMASMSLRSAERMRVLDAGAGAGVLTAALVTKICSLPNRPKELSLTAYEIDEGVLPDLRRTLNACEQLCSASGISCRWEIRATDFIESAVISLDEGLFQTDRLRFDIAIVNPPYKKFRSESRVRQLLRRLDIETSNLYAAFLALVVSLLNNEGELVAITPRSFCNGPYFRPFREFLLRNVNLTRLHVFDSRGLVFHGDKVLQENLIIHAEKGKPQQALVGISQSRSSQDPIDQLRNVSFERVVRPNDPEKFIHLAQDNEGRVIAESMAGLPSTLSALGLTVSTGRVVDFRARQWLRPEATPETVPLIYPTHFDNGLIRWPKASCKKPNAIVYNSDSANLMVPSGVYVLVRRFSAKEERRRIVAAIFDPATVSCEVVGFENHVNYFHAAGGSLNRTLARGLLLFLNSTPLDAYFRQFNGHTQVNATDLRALRYPTREVLVEMGRRIDEVLPPQDTIDEIVAKSLRLL
jgi:adenine-specific DNA-methyltransferase